MWSRTSSPRCVVDHGHCARAGYASHMPSTGSTRPTASLALAPGVILLAAVSERAGDAATRRLSWAVIGLLVLGGAIAVATVVFWRLTRPEPAPAPVAEGASPVDWLAAFSGTSTDAAAAAAPETAPGTFSLGAPEPHPDHGGSAVDGPPTLARREPGATRHGVTGIVPSDTLGNV